MIAGGCDKDCHIRRFKTKLIAMGMLGYDRVIVEPSGIFDVDEFFDILHEEPIDRWYEIGSVITIVDGSLGNKTKLSKHSRFMLATQLSCCGCAILSRTQDLPPETIESTKEYIGTVMDEFTRVEDANDCIKEELQLFAGDWYEFSHEDYNAIMSAGYRISSIEKLWFDEKAEFQSLYFMNTDHTPKEIATIAERLFNDGGTNCYGNVLRIKGFLQQQDDSWVEVNATRDGNRIAPIEKGQKVIIVIGENLNEEMINRCFEKP